MDGEGFFMCLHFFFQVNQQKEKGKLKHLNDFVIQKSTMNDYDRNICTPRQVQMDFYR